MLFVINRLCLCVSFLSVVSCATVEQVKINTQRVDLLSDSSSNWHEKSFSGYTQYSKTKFEGRSIIQAVSHHRASALYKRVKIDLNKTPYLNWQWRVGATLGEIDETSKAGDDYAARLYVIFAPELFGVMPRSLNYVWASQQPQYSSWVSPYADKIWMLSLQSGDENAGKWIMEKRNVKADIKAVFGKDIRFIEMVAMMTDTDNTRKSATAAYANIFFSAD